MSFNSAVGSFNTGTGAIGTTVVVSGLGFQPKVVFFWWNGRTETTDTVGRRTHQRGFGAAISTTDRRRANSLSQDTPTAMVTNRSQDDAECIALTTISDTVDGLMDVQSFDSGGFTLVVDDVFTADYRIHYLAIGGTDITNVTGGNFAKATVTGDQDITSVGFQPDLVLFFGVGQTTLTGSIATDSKFCMGAIDGAGRQAVFVGGSNDGAANAQAMSYANDIECLAMFDSGITVINDRAQYTSMLSNGFRINWIENTGATADIYNYIAIKGGSFRVDSLLTQVDTTTDIVKSGFGFSPSSALFVSHGKSESAADTPQDDDEWSCGAFVDTTHRAAMAVSDDDAAGTAVVSSATEHDEIYININASTGAIEGLMNIKTVDSGGFTCIMDDADPSQSFVWFIAFGPTPSSTNTPISVTVTITDTISELKNVGKSFSITETTSISTTKVINKTLSIVIGTVISILKSIALLKTISIITTPLIQKVINKLIQITTNVNVSMIKGFGYIQAVTITVSTNVTISKFIGYVKNIQVGVTANILITKVIAKILSHPISTNVIIQKNITLVLIVIITSIISILKNISKTISTIVATLIHMFTGNDGGTSYIPRVSRNINAIYTHLEKTAISILRNSGLTAINKKNSNAITLRNKDNDDIYY